MQPTTAVPFALVALLLAVEWPTFARFRRGAHSRDGGSYWVLHIGIPMAYVLAFTLSRYRPLGIDTRLSTSVVGIGAAVFAVGLGIRAWAISTLGRLFTRDVRVSADQPIVATGPFRWMRHPSYTGLLLEAVGIAIALRSTLSILLVVTILVPAIGYRVLVEERALREHVGPAYAEYARRVRRFVPFVV